MMRVNREMEMRENLKYILEKYKDLDSTNLNDVNNILDRVILDFDTFDKCPNIILTRALYVNESTGDFLKGKFVIRPSIKYNLGIKDMKYSFTLINNSNFFEEFINNVIEWVVNYWVYSELEHNLELLNSTVFCILQSLDFPYNISFTLGEGIMDISDEYIVLGLDSDSIMSIPSLGFFIEDEYWKSKYINNFINVLKECNRPYDIVKVKADFTKEMKIYSRKSVNKLLRKVVSRKIDFVRVGIGYAEDKDIFALIERVAVTPENAKKYDIDSIILTDNESPTTQEKKKGLTKIVTKYKLMPFEKKTNVLIDMGLKEFLNSLCENSD